MNDELSVLSKLITKTAKLPEEAERVFKGVMFEVYQWQQKMYDNSIMTFERLKRIDTVTVIATVGNRIILQEQEQPIKGKFFSFPGGACDHEDNTPLMEAKRELFEETGYSSDDIFFWRDLGSRGAVCRNDYFIARNCLKIAEPQLDSGEKITNKLISYGDFLMLSEQENFRHRDFALILFYLRLHPDASEQFWKMLFSKK
jgi:ADP-ribose pyrophosphatase